MKEIIRIRINEYSDEERSIHSAELYLIRRIVEKSRSLVKESDESINSLKLKELKDAVDDFDEWISEGCE